ncbi:hypothetical protein NUACC21_68630 [Scytonema sp. NUACC21]
MKKQILSIALALPTILLSTIPCLADITTPAKVKLGTSEAGGTLIPGASKRQAEQLPATVVPNPIDLSGRRCPGRCIPDTEAIKSHILTQPGMVHQNGLSEFGGSKPTQQVAPNLPNW